MECTILLVSLWHQTQLPTKSVIKLTYFTAITCGERDGHITSQNSRQIHTHFNNITRFHNTVDSLLKTDFHSWM